MIDAEVNLWDVEIDPSQKLTDQWQGELLGSVMTVEGAGCQADRSTWEKNGLYRPFRLENQYRELEREVKLTAIPYYAWGNRGLKSMRVWIPYTH